MTNNEFQHLLDMAISRGNLNEVGLDKVYVMLTWWSDEFRPLTDLDVNWMTGEKICVFGDRDISCNKWHDGLPCAFWICKDAVRMEDVTHRPLSLKTLYEMKNAEDAPRRFLISDSPQNIFVDINPFRTRIIRNYEGETMLCFYVSDHGGEERVPFKLMKESSIDFIDATKVVGKYKYGSWKAESERKTPEDFQPDACVCESDKEQEDSSKDC